MEGVALSLNEAELKAFQRLLGKLGESALSQQFWEVVGAVGESQIRHTISTLKADPETGTPWQALDETYAKNKAKVSSGGILEREGNLLDSITFEASNTGVEIGSNKIYATTHQFGLPKKRIPARPFIGLTNYDELQQTVQDWYAGVANAK